MWMERLTKQECFCEPWNTSCGVSSAREHAHNYILMLSFDTSAQINILLIFTCSLLAHYSKKQKQTYSPHINSNPTWENAWINILVNLSHAQGKQVYAHTEKNVELLQVQEMSTYGDNKTNNHPPEDRLLLKTASVPPPRTPPLLLPHKYYLSDLFKSDKLQSQFFGVGRTRTMWRLCLWGLLKLLQVHF